MISVSHTAYLQPVLDLPRALWVAVIRLQKPVLLGYRRYTAGLLFLTGAPISLEFPTGNWRQAGFAHYNELLTIPGKPEGFGDRGAGGGS